MKATESSTTFDYRIIEKEYNNYLTYDEGPGSSTSVDATCCARVVRVWKEMPESFGEDLLKGGHGLYLQEDSPDGYYEYTYVVERAKTGTCSWEWNGILPRSQSDY